MSAMYGFLESHRPVNVMEKIDEIATKREDDEEMLNEDGTFNRRKDFDLMYRQMIEGLKLNIGYKLI